MLQFEYDAAKSQANLAKHGMDFETARRLWEDEARLVVPARTDGEPRFALIAAWGGKVWTAVFTHRGSAVRLISVRHAREHEEEAYHHDEGI